MQILFADTQLRIKANSLEQMVQEFGQKKARKIRQRLDELHAAHCLADFRTLPGVRCRSVISYPNLISICTLPPSSIRLRMDSNEYFDKNGILNWVAIETVTVIHLNENDYE